MSHMLPLYQVLARKLAWNPPPDTQYVEQRRAEIKALVDLLPSGSGWDNGTEIDEIATSPTRLVLYGSFHHMDEYGYYDGWTDHQIVVTPSLQNDFELRITGQNRNDIKDYLHEMFDFALRQPVDEWAIRDKAKPAEVQQ